MVKGQLGNVLRCIRMAVRGPAARDLTDKSLLERFASVHDEAAFETLVQRHGPMVQGVCRRVLSHAQDAEDAFQATFLVLSRKAGRISWHAEVSNWLYKVAYRTALRMRASRKWVRERQMVDLPAAGGRDEVPWDDVRPILDEELNRLPDKYREPVVLHYLEGKSYAETAKVLGWAEGTVSGRLARARDLLRRRLARRGLALSGTLVATMLADQLGTAAVPALLIQTTVLAVRLFVGGQALGAVFTQAAFLAERVLKAMLMTRFKIAAAAVLALSLLGMGTGLLTWPMRAADAGQEKPPEAQGTLARRIMRQQPAVGDLASVLHIHKSYCEVEFGVVPRSATLRVEFEFYKNGRKTSFAVEGGAIQMADRVYKHATISLQAADLDYLPLAGGQKRHCRVQVDLEVDSTQSGSGTDIPKDVFDFSQVRGNSGFPVAAGSPTEVPLFFLVANTNLVTGANTVKEAIENNQKGDLLIAFLRVAK